MEKNNLPEGLTLLKDVNFRTIYHQFLYIHCRNVLEEVFPEDITAGDTGLLVYSYIDENAGITFKPLAVAAFKDGIPAETGKPAGIENCLLRYHGSFVKNEFPMEDGGVFTLATIPAGECSFLNLVSTDIDLDQYAEVEEDIRRNYDLNKDPLKEMMRSKKYSYLDRFRSPYSPDDVMVIFFGENVKPESVWVRCSFEAEAEKELYGMLLTEPKSFPKFKRGMVIGFTPYGEGDDMLLVATGHTSTIFTQE